MPIVAVRTAAQLAAARASALPVQPELRTDIVVRPRVRRLVETMPACNARAALAPAPQEVLPAAPEDEEEDEKVGYKNPPKRTQFKKGQSGNPKGRPKGAKSLKTIARERLTEKVTVKTAKGPKRMSRMDAMFLKYVELAFNGNVRAAQFCMGLYETAVPDEQPRSPTQVETILDMDAHDEAILAALHETLLARGTDE